MSLTKTKILLHLSTHFTLMTRICFGLIAAFMLLCQPEIFAQLTQTNLPILIINTNGVPVADTQVMADFKIINNASGNNTPSDPPQYSGKIGINLRSSTPYPKRSFNVETWSGFKVSMDTSLLGMPSENDWVLISSYLDRSLQRNLIGFRLFQQMGNYAPRMKPCEVIINNSYAGVYLFGERIKRDKNRVDIANLRNIDNGGLEITGGYIFRVDETNDASWNSTFTPPFATGTQSIRFHYYFPQGNEITAVQKAYIKSYVDSFENELVGTDYQDTTIGWRRHFGHRSLKDFIIFNEVLRGSDAYRMSAFLYKDKGKKLRIGPPWGLEQTLFNATDCNASKDTGWSYQYNVFCGNSDYLTPFWWSRLMTDTMFSRELKCRYQELRATALDTTAMFAYIDSMASYLNAQGAVTRNFALYPIWGTPIANEPLPVSGNYGEETAKIKGYLRRRLQYLDSQWPAVACNTTSVPSLAGSLGTIRMYPNPASDELNMDFNLTTGGFYTLRITDIMGKTWSTKALGTLNPGWHQTSLPLQSLPAGTYFLFVEGPGKSTTAMRFVHQ